MDIIFIVAGVLLAYLVGSVPTAVWYSKLFYGIDIREYGSGNSGATNSFRVMGKKAGSIVMLIDVLKGAAGASIAYILEYFHLLSPERVPLWMLLFGIATALGHIFPAYAGFRGGKGVATLLGMIVAINFEAALVCMAVFFTVLLISRYVSLGSMLAALAFPVVLLLPRFNPDEPLMIVLAFGLFSIVTLTHQKNIKRLINGEENKANLRIRKK